MLVMQLRVASCGKVRRASSGPSSFEQLLCSYVCAWAALVLSPHVCVLTSCYASVGGATRHTVVGLSFSHSVCQSVATISRSSQKTNR